MVSVRLPSDALLQHLPTYLGFSYLGHGVSLHGCSSKAQPLLLTLDEGYLLTTAVPDLQRGIAPLGPPVSAQPPLLGLLLPAAGPGLGRVWLSRMSGSRSCCSWPRAQGGSSRSPSLASGVRWLLLAASNLGRGVFPPSCHWPPSCGSSSRPPPGHRTWGVPSLPPSLTSDTGCLLPTSAPDLRRGVAPPSVRP